MICGGRGPGSLSPSPSHSQAARSTVTHVQQSGDLGEHKSFSGRIGNGWSLTSPGRPASSTPVLPAPSQVPPSLSHSAAPTTTFSSRVPAIALSIGPHFSHHPTSFPPGLASSSPAELLLPRGAFQVKFSSPRRRSHHPGRFLQGVYDNANSPCVLANRFLLGRPGGQGPASVLSPSVLRIWGPADQ